MAEAYFAEGGRMRRYPRVSHTASGRRRRGADADADGGFLPFLPMIASALVPKAVGWVADKIMGKGEGDGMRRRHRRHRAGEGEGEGDGMRLRRSAGDGRRSLHSRLAHHELGFQGLGEGDLEDVSYFDGSGTRKGMMRLTARPAYMGAEGEGHTGGRRRRHYRAGEGEGEGDGMRRRRRHRAGEGEGEGDGMRRRHHRRRGADADADGEGRRKRRPSARNMLVKKVMRERGCSLPEASRIVKQEGLY